jgi:hypothetical protein
MKYTAAVFNIKEMPSMVMDFLVGHLLTVIIWYLFLQLYYLFYKKVVSGLNRGPLIITILRFQYYFKRYESQLSKSRGHSIKIWKPRSAIHDNNLKESSPW